MSGDGRRRPGTRTPGRVSEVCRVPGRRRVGGGELGGDSLPQHDRSVPLQHAHRDGVVVRNPAAQHPGAGGCLEASGANDVLQPDGDPGERQVTRASSRTRVEGTSLGERPVRPKTCPGQDRAVQFVDPIEACPRPAPRTTARRFAAVASQQRSSGSSGRLRSSPHRVDIVKANAGAWLDADLQRDSVEGGDVNPQLSDPRGRGYRHLEFSEQDVGWRRTRPRPGGRGAAHDTASPTRYGSAPSRACTNSPPRKT